MGHNSAGGDGYTQLSLKMNVDFDEVDIRLNAEYGHCSMMLVIPDSNRAA